MDGPSPFQRGPDSQQPGAQKRENKRLRSERGQQGHNMKNSNDNRIAAVPTATATKTRGKVH